ncbi:MAG: preprotein translocase subunit SecE [Chloroflexi bacterium RBG_16_48_8]|nr:MAG: preprotein translocase subunit SecE [Chloroflexi bacterium RBG_16_48_8]
MKKVSRKKQNSIARYFRETMGELRKVNWPTRHQATQLTLIVLVVIGFTSVLLGAMDLLFSRLFAFLITLGG